MSPGTGPQRGAAYDPEASLRTETSVGKIQKPEELLSLLFIFKYRDGIFKQSMGARNRVEIGLSYRPAGLHRLAEFIPWS